VNAQPVEGVPAHRRMITATVMVASILQALDNTIANVALPRM
jgi:DHA2 family multidrug resistance protein